MIGTLAAKLGPTHANTSGSASSTSPVATGITIARESFVACAKTRLSLSASPSVAISTTIGKSEPFSCMVMTCVVVISRWATDQIAIAAVLMNAPITSVSVE